MNLFALTLNAHADQLPEGTHALGWFGAPCFGGGEASSKLEIKDPGQPETGNSRLNSFVRIHSQRAKRPLTKEGTPNHNQIPFGRGFGRLIPAIKP